VTSDEVEDEDEHEGYQTVAVRRLERWKVNPGWHTGFSASGGGW